MYNTDKCRISSKIIRYHRVDMSDVSEMRLARKKLDYKRLDN